MEKLKRLKCLNKLTLQIFAMATMLLDHIWGSGLVSTQWLTCVGRLAFPIFAFFIAEGFAHTHDWKQYLKRMAIFAVISEVPFDLMAGGTPFYPIHQNVMFTFCIALLCLAWLDRLKKKHQGSLLWAADILLVCLVGFVAGTVTFVDYYGYGVLTVIIFYLCRDSKWGWLASLICLWYINWEALAGLVYTVGSFEFPQQGLALLSLPLIWLYNGKQGPHNKAIQYGCYAFYPVHLTIVGVLAVYIL